MAPEWRDWDVAGFCRGQATIRTRPCELRLLLENPAYREAAARIGEVVRQEQGARSAADEIESVLRVYD